MTSSILAARNLSKVVSSTEGELTILHDLDLDLNAGLGFEVGFEDLARALLRCGDEDLESLVAAVAGAATIVTGASGEHEAGDGGECDDGQGTPREAGGG